MSPPLRASNEGLRRPLVDASSGGLTGPSEGIVNKQDWKSHHWIARCGLARGTARFGAPGLGG